MITFSSIGQTGQWWKGGNDQDEKQTDTSASVNIEKDSAVYKKGKVTVSKDPRIEKLIEFKGAKIPPATGPKKDGFRVQLFFDQDRKQVDQARSKILQIDGAADTYIEYNAPNYNLLLGNYRTRLEAEKVRSTLLEEFPEAITVKDRIYFPEIEDK
jgi:hypothetical protein